MIDLDLCATLRLNQPHLHYQLRGQVPLRDDLVTEYGDDGIYQIFARPAHGYLFSACSDRGHRNNIHRNSYHHRNKGTENDDVCVENESVICAMAYGFCHVLHLALALEICVVGDGEPLHPPHLALALEMCMVGDGELLHLPLSHREGRVE